MAMMDYKVRSASAEMDAMHRRYAGVRMTKYPSTSSDSRPLPIARKGQRFSAAEKMLADRAWREKYLEQ